MTAKKPIVQNARVTVDLGRYNTASNTYIVSAINDSDCYLNHPLAEEIFIVKDSKELNLVQANLQNSVEKCLFFAKQYQQELSHSTQADLWAMIYFFVVRKDFTMKQRSELAQMCGRIASVILHNNIRAATDLIKPNRALLDDFHITLYNQFEKVINNPTLLKVKAERYVIYNIAGFIMAQTGEGK